MTSLRPIYVARVLQGALLALALAACASAPVAPSPVPPPQNRPCVRIEDPDPWLLDGGAAENAPDGGGPRPETLIDGSQAVVVTKPRFLDGAPWHWTEDELSHRFQVLVLAQCELPVDGRPEGCHVLLGFPEIDDARIVAYVEGLHFAPAKLADGHAVGVRHLTIPLRLQSPGTLTLRPAVGSTDEPAVLDKWVRPPSDAPRQHVPWTSTPEQLAADAMLDLHALCVVTDMGKPVDCRTERRPPLVPEAQLQAYLASLTLVPARAAEGRDVAVKGCEIEVVARPSRPPAPKPVEQVGGTLR